MSKYMVGDELLVVDTKDEDAKKLHEMTKLKVNDHFAKLSLGLQILNVDYDKPNVTLTYRNIYGEVNKVFAICSDIENFDTEKALEKSLLKAFQSELINISVKKNSGNK